MNSLFVRIACAVILLAALYVRPRAAAQLPAAPTVAAEQRLSFFIVESYDARYSGDTPGHIGRVGGLEDRRPLAALGDPVYRDDRQVGVVTELIWSRAQGSLTVDFDPLPGCRVCVGDSVWLHMREEAN